MITTNGKIKADITGDPAINKPSNQTCNPFVKLIKQKHPPTQYPQLSTELDNTTLKLK